MITALWKKYFWIVKLVFVAVLASESAMFVNNHLDAKLGNVETARTGDMKSGSPPTYVALSDYKALMTKNIFNSDYVYLDGALTGGAGRPEDYLLLGTIAWDQPYSMAIIMSKSGGKTGVFRAGDNIAEDAEVVSIERKRVTLQRAGRQEILTLPDIEIQSVEGTVKSADATSGDGKIKQTGPNEFVIAKDLIEELFRNPFKLASCANIAPAFEKGGIGGFQFKRIRNDCLFGKIGLRDGDVIRRINNIEIKGLDETLKLMTDLRSAKNVSMDITRDGERLSYKYSVR